MADNAPRRRLDTASRRSEILAAARRLYASAGYAEVTSAQVAEAADASQALVFHYFSGKAGLYAAVVTSELADLHAAQSAATDALPDGAPPRDRVRASLAASLDHITAHPAAWRARASEEPEAAHQVRLAARAEDMDRLGRLLGVHGWERHTYALWGFFGFLDQAFGHWMELGSPAEHREPLIEAALGALEGALGDWAV